MHKIPPPYRPLFSGESLKKPFTADGFRANPFVTSGAKPCAQSGICGPHGAFGARVGAVVCVALMFAVWGGLPAQADAPVVEGVTFQKGNDSWRFSVTLSHPDTGWDHYADGWRIETAEGAVLGTRILTHPHVNEQPFTRSLGGVSLPDGLTEVFVRAKCNVDGWSEETMRVDLSDNPSDS